MIELKPKPAHARRPGILRALRIWKKPDFSPDSPWNDPTPGEVKAAADLIELVANRIASIPETYDQGQWCGSSYCLAGHTLASLSPQRFKVVMKAVLCMEEARNWEVEEMVQHEFGDSWQEKARLALLAPEDAFAHDAGSVDVSASPTTALHRIARDFRQKKPKTLKEAHAIWLRHWN